MAGVIINHDQALKQREDFNLLYEPIEDMVKSLVEAWEKNDPLEPLFVRDSIDRLQKTYSSSIGYDQVMSESANYAVGELSNTQSGFRKTVSTRPFRGSKIIAQEVIDDTPEDIGKELSKWTKAWMRNRVQYALKSLDAGFGNTVKWGDPNFGVVSPMLLKSADTIDGVVETQVTNPLFINTHTIVKREFEKLGPRQSNKYVAPGIKIGSSDPGQLAKLADVINWVKAEMDLWLDDNGQRVDYSGEKVFVTGYDSRIETAMNIILTEKYVGGPDRQNPALNAGVHKYHSMYNDIDALRPVYGKVNANGTVVANENVNDRSGVLLGFGMFIVNKTYMSENNGLTFLERLPLTIKGVSLGQNDMNPEGVGYKGYCRFDIVNCTWRGIAYIWIGDTRVMPECLKITDSALATQYSLANADTAKTAISSMTADTTTMAQGTGSFTLVTPVETIVKPVSVVGTVSTKEQA